MIIWFYILISAVVCIGVAMLAMMLDRIRAIESKMARIAGNTQHLAYSLADTIEIVSGQTEAICDHARELDALTERRSIEVVQ